MDLKACGYDKSICRPFVLLFAQLPHSLIMRSEFPQTREYNNNGIIKSQRREGCEQKQYDVISQLTIGDIKAKEASNDRI